MLSSIFGPPSPPPAPASALAPAGPTTPSSNPIDGLLASLTCGDIIEHAKLLLAFLDELHRLEERKELPLKDPAYLSRAVERYLRFIDIRAADASVLPPVDVAFVWLCHLLRPSDYLRSMMGVYKAVLQPDGDIFRSVHDAEKRRLAANMWNSIFPDDPFTLTLAPSFRGAKETGLARRDDLIRTCTQFLAFVDSVRASGLPVHSSVFLQRGARRWIKFMILSQRHPTVILIPTLDIEIMWVTHLQNPRAYKEDSERIVGHLLLHDEYMPLQDLAGTSELWEAEFGEEYVRNPWGILSGRMASQAHVPAVMPAPAGPSYVAQGGRALSTVLVPGFRFTEQSSGPDWQLRSDPAFPVGAENVNAEAGDIDGLHDLGLRASLAAATGRASAARTLGADLVATKGRAQSVSFAVEPATPENLAPRSFNLGGPPFSVEGRTRSVSFAPNLGSTVNNAGSPYELHSAGGADFNSPASMSMLSMEGGELRGLRSRGRLEQQLKHSFVSRANLGTTIYDSCCECRLCERCVEEGCPKCECGHCECRACPDCCRGISSACGHCFLGCCNACGQACGGMGQACGSACIECRNTCRQSCAPCCTVLEECGKSCSICVGGIVAACAPLAKWLGLICWFVACLAVFAIGIAFDRNSSYDDSPGWEFARLKSTWSCQLMACVGGLAFWAGVAYAICASQRPFGGTWARVGLFLLGALGIAGGFAFTEEGRGEVKNCVGVIVATMGTTLWTLVAIPWLHRYFVMNMLAPDGLMIFIWGIVQQRRLGNNPITLYLVIFGAIAAFVPIVVTFLVWSGPSHQRAIRYYLGRNYEAVPQEKLDMSARTAGAAYIVPPGTDFDPQMLSSLSQLNPDALKLIAAAAAASPQQPSDVTYSV